MRLPRPLLAVGLLGAVAVAGALLLAVLVALLRLGGARRAQLGRRRALAALRLGVRAGRGPLQGPPDPAILAIESARVRRPGLTVAAAGVAAGGGFSRQPVRPARRSALPHPAGQAALLSRQGYLRGLSRQLSPAPRTQAHRRGGAGAAARTGAGTCELSARFREGALAIIPGRLLPQRTRPLRRQCGPRDGPMQGRQAPRRAQAQRP